LLRFGDVRKRLYSHLCVCATLVAVSGPLLSGCFWHERRDPHYEEHRHYDRDHDHDREEHREHRHD
jgi:hypothetical protein